MIVFGLSVSLIGMGTVLFALVLLMGIIKVLGHIAAVAGEAAPPPERRKRKRIPREPAVVSLETVAAKDQQEEIAVVIAAALEACLRES